MTQQKTLFTRFIAILLIAMTVACSGNNDDIDALKSEVASLKEAVALLKKAGDESKTIREVKKLTDAAGWQIVFSDGTTIRLEDTITITEDPDTQDTTIKLPNGDTFTFAKENVRPTGIVVLTKSISMSPNGVVELEFRVNPSNASFNYNADSNNFALAIDLIESTRSNADSYVTPPTHYKIRRIEPASDQDGNNKVGQYVAYIQDLGTLQKYHQTAALVLTTNGSDNQAVQYTSELFEVSSGKLPVLFMQTPGNQGINSKDNWLENCTLTLVTADGEDEFQLSKVSLRGRGNSTWGYPKKPYAIKLDKKAEILGMPAHKRWVLLANWMDRTLMRNSVSFEVARQTDLAYTPRGAFVEVVLNGNHLGNYYLCEQIKIDENRVNVAELEDSDTQEPTITGGYLMELDTYYDEVNKFKTKHRSLPVNFKEPDEEVLNSQQKNYVEQYFNRIEDILYASAQGDYNDYIDTESFIDWWLVHELTGNFEPLHPKSSYMHKDRNGKLAAGPVWDFDWATFIPNRNNFGITISIWYDKLFEDPAFKASVKARWKTLKPRFESVIPFIDAQAAYIRQSAIVDGNMWPITMTVNGDEKMTFDNAVLRLREAYAQRIITLDRLINEEE